MKEALVADQNLIDRMTTRTCVERAHPSAASALDKLSQLDGVRSVLLFEARHMASRDVRAAWR